MSRRTAQQLDAIVLVALDEVPRSAYQLSAALTQTARPLKPPQVYRILHRLVAAGLARRIALLKGYIRATGRDEVALWCSDCGNVQSASSADIANRLRHVALVQGFVPAQLIVECVGRCADCQRGASVAPK